MSRLGLLAAVAVIGITAPGAARAEPLSVVATFSILGDMVSRVGGDRVEVTTLVGPGGDAHVYQPTPADARIVADADLVVVNGLGFEGFIARLTEAAEYAGPVVTASAGVRPLVADGEADDDHSDDDHSDDDHDHDDGHDHHEDHDDQDEHAAETGEGHEHGPLDPHAWQNVGNALAYVTEIERGLCAVDAQGCPTFAANADIYRAELTQLDADIRSRISAIPENRRIVITSHDAFGYFGEAYGVAFLAPQGVSTESEASARDVAALIEQIRESGVRVIFVESISDPRLVQRIASETGSIVGPALFSDALSGPGQGAETYLAMMRHNADAMIAAMQPDS